MYILIFRINFKRYSHNKKPFITSLKELIRSQILKIIELKTVVPHKRLLINFYKIMLKCLIVYHFTT